MTRVMAFFMLRYIYALCCSRRNLSLSMAMNSLFVGLCLAEEETDFSIDFESPILIYEDDNIRIELQSFFHEFMNWGDPGRKPAFEKGLLVKYYNKTDYEVWIQLREAYLGMDAVCPAKTAGNEAVAPGKASICAYQIWQYAGTKYKPLAQ